MADIEKTMWKMKLCYRLVLHLAKTTPGGLSVDATAVDGRAAVEQKVAITTIGDKVHFRVQPNK